MSFTGSSQVVVDIQISSQEFVRWYSGSAKDVQTRARDGRKVRFPAKILQKYVTRGGINGVFLITFGHDRRFQKIDRL